jgi:hypothetical protein
MNTIKAYTMKKTGNYVRYFTLLFFSMLIINACEPIDEDSGDSLEGSWTCKETIDGSSSSFTVTISLSDTDSKIYIDNFNQLDIRVYALISGSSLTIPQQTVDGFKISGSGTVSSDNQTIHWTYSVYDGADTESVTAVYSKK